MELPSAAAQLKSFTGDSLRTTIANLEKDLRGSPVAEIPDKVPQIGSDLLEAAVVLKEVAGQVNVLIHAVGILLSLPHILDDGEVVESLSLGAGNTGRDFDLVTDRRLAEFKFIQWRGGAESIRQNSIFKDFF